AGCRTTGQEDIRFAPRAAAAATLLPPLRTEANLALRQNIPFVEVHVNGHGPYLFAVDTGVNVTVLSDHILDELRGAGAGTARRYRARARGAAGDQVPLAGVFHVHDLSVGAQRFEDFHAAVLDMTHVRQALGEDVAGILGFSLFHDRLVTIDYPGARLIIESGALPAPDERDILALTREDGLPVLPVNFNGREISLVIDTGSDQAFALPRTLADDLEFDGELMPGPMAATIGGISRRLIGRCADDARLGGWRVVRPEIMITDGRARIGGDVLSNFVVTFDQLNNTVRLAESTLAPIPLADALTTVDVPAD
ncbi:MAG: aspartyl protease family protein, partial [Phycisphaerales bacterium]|nr:aspartyl protease family protein [Phycisphaerales bacterium]